MNKEVERRRKEFVLGINWNSPPHVVHLLERVDGVLLVLVRALVAIVSGGPRYLLLGALVQRVLARVALQGTTESKSQY